MNAPTPESRLAALSRGVRAVVPLLLGVSPFSLLVGAAATDGGYPAAAALAQSPILFAGAAQLAAIQLFVESAPLVMVVLTIWVINLRFAMYSASIGTHFEGQPLAWRAFAAYILTDQAYAISILHYGIEPRSPLEKRWYYTGAAMTLWLVWQTGTAIGVAVGTQIPESWQLDFAIPVVFLALLVPHLKDRASIAAATAGAIVVVVASGLPLHLGFMVGVAAAIATGVLFEGRRRESA